MSEIQNSPLLNRILERADGLRRDFQCSGVTRDFIIVAAIITVGEDKDSLPSEMRHEAAETAKLLAHLSWSQESLRPILQAWRGKQVPSTESIILLSQKGKAISAARAANQTELSASLYLYTLLKDEPDSIKSLHKQEEPPAAPGKPAEKPAEKTAGPEVPAWLAAVKGVSAQRAAQAAPSEEPAPPPAEDSDMQSIVLRTKKLERELQSRVLDQPQAVSAFVTGYFHAELQAAITKDRKLPRATFLFAGPPGVGKTYLAESAAEILNLPFRRFDMSEYSNANATDELCGTDQNYKASSEGLLTGFVTRNPRCILLFDEIEKARTEVLYLFLQVLDAGRLRDNRTDKEVSFHDTLIIFTTNAGKNLYEDGRDQNLSAMSRDVILDALAKDVNPRTNEPYFPGALCSRFAMGNVVMYNYLSAHTLRRIVSRQLEKHMANLKDGMSISFETDSFVPTAILLAEGASADARAVKSRADSFFSSELYELFRLITSARTNASANAVQSVGVHVDIESALPEVKKLFVPEERIHALYYGESPLPALPEDAALPVIHMVRTMDEAKNVMDQESVQLVLCSLFAGGRRADSALLNHEDILSPARDFLFEILQRYPGKPVLLTEPAGAGFSEEEKDSYLRRGVRGFLSVAPEGLADRLRAQADVIFQQNSLSSLARSNQLIRFETAQELSADGRDARITLFDMRLEKAVKAEDTDNVLSMLSTPDQRFDDVIGAEDAKNELRFFVSYIKNPQKYIRIGAAAPKGILLYGPPGTGKTMLAKAFAAEAGATFIATEGNKFFKKYIGEGPEMVHRLFATARRYAPSVLFVDEIDNIARMRTGGDNAMSQDTEQILTAFFSEMDGFISDPGKPVFVLGATNYGVDEQDGMRLDPAMLRRFDRRILIELPNTENRLLYLQKQCAKKPILRISEEEMRSLADRSTGMSLAQLASVLDMAVRTAVQREMDGVTDELLEETFETFNSGEKKAWSQEVVLRTARHEAGHTLVSWLGGEKPSYVTIVSRADYGGYMQHENREDRFGYSRKELLQKIRTALGGRAAELVCYGPEDGLTTGASGDLRQATELARRLLCAFGMDDDFGLFADAAQDRENAAQLRQAANRILREQLDEAVRLVSAHRAALDALVAQLLEKNSLKQEDIDKTLSGVV